MSTDATLLNAVRRAQKEMCKRHKRHLNKGCSPDDKIVATPAYRAEFVRLVSGCPWSESEILSALLELTHIDFDERYPNYPKGE